MSILGKPYFHDEAAAFEHVESVIWPDGPVCPHCGALDRISKIAPNPKARVRFGLHKCGHCKGQFTVRVGTVFEASKVPLHKWLQAIYLMCSNKNGISAHQLHRVLEVTYKTAWFMEHRIRQAIRDGDLSPFDPNGGAVEVDETFISHDATIKPRHSKKGRGVAHKRKVLALVDRGSGRARTMVVDDLKASTIAPIVRENVASEAHLMTDEGCYHTLVSREFAAHGVVRHNRGEYGRSYTHMNTIEGCFSISKRGMKGVYQRCAKRHLNRYLAEFEFRYNNRVANGLRDSARSAIALRGTVGKRLIYGDSSATRG